MITRPMRATMNGLHDIMIARWQVNIRNMIVVVPWQSGIRDGAGWGGLGGGSGGGSGGGGSGDGGAKVEVAMHDVLCMICFAWLILAFIFFNKANDASACLE